MVNKGFADKEIVLSFSLFLVKKKSLVRDNTPVCLSQILRWNYEFLL